MKISVVTVCRDAVGTIEDTILTVAGQTFENVEHIIVDGASTDGTLDIIRKHESKITKWVSEPDKGIYDAMNKGLALATGEIVGFLNADDLYADSSVLGQIADVFQDKTVDACYADLVYVDKQDTNTIVRYWKSSQFSSGAFSSGWCPAHPTFYARRSVFDRLGYFDDSYKLAADAELLMRFLEYGHISSRYVPEVWVKMRLGGETNRNVMNIIRQNMEIIDALKKHGLHSSVLRFAWRKVSARFAQRFHRPNEK